MADIRSCIQETSHPFFLASSLKCSLLSCNSCTSWQIPEDILILHPLTSPDLSCHNCWTYGSYLNGRISPRASPRRMMHLRIRGMSAKTGETKRKTGKTMEKHGKLSRFLVIHTLSGPQLASFVWPLGALASFLPESLSMTRTPKGVTSRANSMSWKTSWRSSPDGKQPWNPWSTT